MVSFLLWKVRALSCGNQVVGVSSDVHVSSTPGDVHPKSTEHLAGAMALDKCIEFGHSGGQCGTVDFVGFKFNEGALLCSENYFWAHTGR